MDQPVSYDEDVLAWSEQQAAVLRELAGRKGLPNQLDLEHVAEEIEDLGRAEFNAVKSYIRQILAHLVKAASEPAPGPACIGARRPSPSTARSSTRSRPPWSRSSISTGFGVVRSRKQRRRWKTRAGRSRRRCRAPALSGWTSFSPRPSISGRRWSGCAGLSARRGQHAAERLQRKSRSVSAPARALAARSGWSKVAVSGRVVHRRTRPGAASSRSAATSVIFSSM